MKLLFIANRFPYPPFRGDKLKIFHLSRRLAARGHGLHLATFLEHETDLQHLPVLREIFSEIELVRLPKWKAAMQVLSGAWDRRPFQVLYFKSREFQRIVDRMLSEHQYDAVHVQHLRMSPYLRDRKDIPRILDLPDAFSLYWERRKSVPGGFFKSLFEGVEQSRVLAYEQKILPSYDKVLTCSPEDLQYLKERHGSTNLALLPNGVDLDNFYSAAHDYSLGNTLLFTGNMDYAPNVDSVVYFVREILPLIREQVPDVRFVIAGQRPVKQVLELASESVIVTGFIENLNEVYSQASVVVAPLRFGAGTQNKVLEALAMGVPVVCSHIGFAGLGIANGEGAFMETDPKRFASRVIELLQSRELRKSTGSKGAQVVRSRFGWDTIATLLEQYLVEVSDGRGR